MIKLIDKSTRKPKTVPFKELKVGQTYLDQYGMVCLKITQSREFDFSENSDYKVPDDEPCIPLKAVLAYRPEGGA